MKIKLISCLLFLTVTLSSCSSDDVPLLNEAKVIERMSSGTWKITNFTFQNVNKTSDYTGVIFDFDAISLTLSNTGTLPVAGSWGVMDDGFDGETDLVVSLALTSVEPRFTNISDDWHIIESTSNKLKLKDENLETGSIDYLTFEKN